jgi:hypothetical protein
VDKKEETETGGKSRKRQRDGNKKIRIKRKKETDI